MLARTRSLPARANISQPTQYSNTSLNDLLAPLSAASGRDLSEWARAVAADLRHVHADTRRRDRAGGKITSFTIRQDAVDPVTGLRPCARTGWPWASSTYDGGSLDRSSFVHSRCGLGR